MLSWLPSKLAVAEKETERFGARWLARIAAPADDMQINDAESALGLSLPNSLKEFFKISNGAFFGIILPKYGEDDPLGVQIFSVADMLMQTKENSTNYGRYDQDGERPFWRSL